MTESQRTGHVRRGGSGRRTGPRRAHMIRLQSAVIVLLGFSAVVSTGVAQASQPRAAAARTWQVAPTPNQNRVSAGINELSAVSCTSVRACTAVGSHAASLSGSSSTLAERWNGTRWRIQATAIPTGAKSTAFSGVSCASAAACTAVGSTIHKGTHRSVNLAEAWNGRRWRLQSIPTPRSSTGGNLSAVSCTSRSACTAVGFYGTATGRVLALAERWNGAAWRIQDVTRPAKVTLSAVSCSSAHACTAAGYYIGTRRTVPIVEVWNGTTWRIQPVPLPHGSPGGALAAVSCTSPRQCTATGANFSPAGPTLAERWNGTRWHVQATPFPADSSTSPQEVELNAVSCASATACTASGEYAPGGQSAYFLEAWNGRRWHMVTAPHPAGFASGALNGVSCVPARCTAVGAWSGGPIFIATLAMAN